MASIGKLTIEAKVVGPDFPVATLGGGVWHCEGRLVTRETAKTAYDEALFWLAIAKAEERITK